MARVWVFQRQTLGRRGWPSDALDLRGHRPKNLPVLPAVGRCGPLRRTPDASLARQIFQLVHRHAGDEGEADARQRPYEEVFGEVPPGVFLDLGVSHERLCREQESHGSLVAADDERQNQNALHPSDVFSSVRETGLQLSQAGKYIGWVERILILTFI